MENVEIRMKAKAANIPLWKIGERLGISENTMTRRLRKPLSSDQKNVIFKVIAEIQQEGNNYESNKNSI